MAKKSANTINYGIWIDHKKAIIVYIDGSGMITEEDLISSVNSRERFPGEGSSKTGLFNTSLNVQAKEQNREQEQMHQFCKRIIAKIPVTAAFVLLVGPAEAKYDLHKEISRKKSLAHIPVEVKTTGKLKAEALAALLNERLDNK